MTATTTVQQVVEGTVMFTDLVGFTEFTAVRGDAEAVELLARQEQLVSRCTAERHAAGEGTRRRPALWFPDALSALRTAIDL